MAKLTIEYDTELNKITKTLEYRRIQYTDNSKPLHEQIAKDFVLPNQVYDAILNIDNELFSEINEIYKYEKVMEEME